jgi:hypothetical protein
MNVRSGDITGYDDAEIITLEEEKEDKEDTEE